MYQHLKIHSDVRNETSVQLHRIELQRIKHLWAVFPGLWFTWILALETSFICSYLEETRPGNLRFHRLFLLLNARSSLKVLKTTNHPNMYTEDYFPFVSKGRRKFVTFTENKTKISHNSSKRLWNVLEISKLEQCHQRLNLMLGATPK